MRTPQEIRELQIQVARDKETYGRIQRQREEIQTNVPLDGFSGVSLELRYRGEMEALAHSIRMGEQVLAAEAGQSDSIQDTGDQRQDPIQVT